jgi:Zn-dependent protease
MMKYALPLGRILGIKVQVHWTFAIILFWIIYVSLRAGANTEQTVWAVLFILAIFGCVVLHEFGHAIAARNYGINTKDITLLPIGGLARLEKIPEKPKEELVVALAGPLVNVLIFFVLMPFVRMPEDLEAAEQWMFTDPGNFLYKLVVINLWLAVFNMIPAFPMDGGRVLRAALSFKFPRHHATRIASSLGQMLAIGFVFLGFFVNPFLIFIGLFIFLGAQSEAQFTQAQFFLKGYFVRDITMRQYGTLKSDDTVQQAVDLLLNSQDKNFLIFRDDQPVGTLSRDELIQALSQRKEQQPVADVMNTELLAIQADTPLEEAFMQMQQYKSLAPIYKNDQLLGALDLENIMEFIMVQTAKEV